MTDQSTQSKTATYSMPGLVYVATPLGSIRLGHTAIIEGERVPVMDDEFYITQPMRNAEGWVRDPIDSRLREETGASRKLREIPVSVEVNDPSLVVRSRLEAFDMASGRPVCASTAAGKAKRRLDSGDVLEVDCVGCDSCQFARSPGLECKFFGRIHVKIAGQTSTLGTYVLRSSSYNTLRSVEAKLWQYWALFGKRLRGVPFVLKLRQISSANSQWQPFYMVDLELATASLEEAMKHALDRATSDKDAGFSLSDFEQVMREGLDNGEFAGGVDEDYDVAEHSRQAASRAVGRACTIGQVGESSISGIELKGGPVQVGSFMAVRAAGIDPISAA